MAKQKYYSIKDIWQSGADYLLLNGERSNGKSYSAKAAALKMAWTEKDPFTGEPVKRYQFAYIRRRDREATGSNALAWLSDMICDRDGNNYISTLTGGECDTMSTYHGKIFFAKLNEHGKPERVKEAGGIFAVNTETVYKSLAYPQIGVLIFEEYITNAGYLSHEKTKLESLVSTILRRDSGRVIMIGNTMSRACPYFQEWQLKNAIHQKPGTIDIYEQITDQRNDDGSPVIVKIAVELCENMDSSSKMFFGQSSKMTTSGEWYSEEQPKLRKPLSDYEQMVDILFAYSGLGFYGRVLYDPEKEVFLLYVEEWEPDDEDFENIPRTVRVLSDIYSLQPNVTPGWDQHFRHDGTISRLISQNKLAFSTNLVGTEFKQMLQDNCL